MQISRLHLTVCAAALGCLLTLGCGSQTYDERLENRISELKSGGDPMEAPIDEPPPEDNADLEGILSNNESTESTDSSNEDDES